MSYLGLSETYWMFANTNGNVIGIQVHKALSVGKAYELAFQEFYG